MVSSRRVLGSYALMKESAKAYATALYLILKHCKISLVVDFALTITISYGY